MKSPLGRNARVDMQCMLIHTRQLYEQGCLFTQLYVTTSMCRSHDHTRRRRIQACSHT